jgi:hypothetical protein
MRTFGKRVDGPTGRRKSLREEVVLAGSALTLEFSRPVVVTDVSAKGAKLIGRELPTQSTSILLMFGDLELFAAVVWSGRDECGIEFEEPLNSDQSEHLKHEGRWANVMGVPDNH